jgi:hypothetical protein
MTENAPLTPAEERRAALNALAIARSKRFSPTEHARVTLGKNDVSTAEVALLEGTGLL